MRIFNRKMSFFATHNGMFKYSRMIYTSVDFQHAIESTLSPSKNSLVLLDLDNTVILPIPLQSSIKKSGFGSDIWFTYMLKQIQHYPDFQKFYMALVAYYCAIQPYLRYVTTEDCVPSLLRKLHEQNIPVLGLTARSSCLAEITLEKLKELNIHFTHNNEPPITLGVLERANESGAIFHGGIIFCSGRNKSECFGAAAQVLPVSTLLTDTQQIIFLDDNKKHCDDMDKWIQKKYISQVTHYKYVEEKIPIATRAEWLMDEKIIKERTGLRFP